MTAVAPEVQERARHAQRQCELGAAAATVAGAVAFGVGAVLAPPFGVLAALMGAGSLIMRAWAEDPPREDFMLAVRPLPLPLRLELLPDEPVARELHGCASFLVSGEALLSSGLLAFEREQGAHAAQAFDAAAARADERRRYQGGAVQALHGAQDAFEELAAAMEAHVGLWTGADPTPATSVDELPERQLASLYRLGVPLAETVRSLELAHEHFNEVRGPRRVVMTLRGVGEPLARLGDALDDWEPEPLKADGGLAPFGAPETEIAERGGEADEEDAVEWRTDTMDA